ncbi:MAG: hypothetical protein K8T10_07495 [Candidatus Eremiobacteraeota bacterium]|nr:hypothetical protein [Candidatus Eremiobacteraeota bacterium]
MPKKNNIIPNLNYSRPLAVSLFVLFFIFIFQIGYAGADFGESWQAQDDNVMFMNTYAKVLDRDGVKQVITDVYDSFETKSFILASGNKGQSPLYKIHKEDVISMELDGFYTNMSGWDYAGCEFVLKGNLRKKGFIQVFQMGLHGYRTFEGKSNVGDFLISWKKLKKIEFLGQWVEFPIKKKNNDDKKKEKEWIQ